MAAAVRVVVMLAVLALLGFGCTSAVAVALEREQPVRGEDYLAAIGADNETRAAAAEAWAAWR